MNIPRTLAEEIARMQRADAPRPVPQVMLAAVSVRYLASFDHGVAVWTSDPTKAMLADAHLATTITNILEHDGISLRQLPITK